jgi:ArsR family metal-binding transcriptional regulator
VTVNAFIERQRETEAGFLNEIRIRQVLECFADPSKIRVIGDLSCDIREAMPYLAALLPRAGYNNAAGTLTIVREGLLFTVYPQVVTLAKAADEDDAINALEWLRRQINEAYARRAEIKPCRERRRLPHWLDVYHLLPGDNCGRCGEATCIAMACMLVFGPQRLEHCPRLREAEFANNRWVLAEWLGVED